MISEIKLFLQNNPSLSESYVNEKLEPLADTFMKIMQNTLVSIVNGTPVERVSLTDEINLIKNTLGVSMTYTEAYNFILKYGRSLIK